jgi:hypothetical protein
MTQMSNQVRRADQSAPVQKADKRGAIDYVTLATLLFFIIISFYLSLRGQTWDGLLWDLNPIIKAVSGQALGNNPYQHSAESMFIYHPYVLIALTWMHNIFPLKYFLGGLYVAIFIWFVWETSQYFKSSNLRCPSWLVLTAALSFGGTALQAMFCGNFSAFFHLSLIALMFQYLRKRYGSSLILFSLAIACFSLVKPYFFAYIIFYFFILNFLTACIFSLAVGAMTSGLWFGGQLSNPEPYKEFLSALEYQIITKDDLGGFSTVRLTAPYIGFVFGFLGHLLIIGALLISCFFVSPLRRCFNEPASQIAIILFFIVAINPRLSFYDFFVCVIAVFFLIMIKFPIIFQRILLFGFPLALYAQIAEHPTRWRLLSFFIVVLIFAFATFWRSKKGQDYNGA